MKRVQEFFRNFFCRHRNRLYIQTVYDLSDDHVCGRIGGRFDRKPKNTCKPFGRVFCGCIGIFYF